MHGHSIEQQWQLLDSRELRTHRVPKIRKADLALGKLVLNLFDDHPARARLGLIDDPARSRLDTRLDGTRRRCDALAGCALHGSGTVALRILQVMVHQCLKAGIVVRILQRGFGGLKTVWMIPSS